MGPGPHVTLQFVTYAGDPNSAATKAAKNAVVRRHAANAVHGRVRRERVLQYQQQQQRQRELEEAPSQQSAARNPGGDEAEVLSPFSYLSPCHVDPFHTGARPLSELESFLLNHCKSILSSVPPLYTRYASAVRAGKQRRVA